MIFWVIFCCSSSIVGVKLVYSYKERGGESSVVGILACLCPIGWNFLG